MTSVAPRGTTDLTEYDYSGIEFESDGTEKISAPLAVIKFVQPTSSMENASKHGAEFFHTDRDTYSEDLDVVILSMKWSRSYFTGDDTGKPVGIASELADVIIRTLDLGYMLGLDMDEAVRLKMEHNKTRPYRHGGKRA